MANKVLHKRSSVAGNAPTLAQFDQGELALNTADKKLYAHDGTTVFNLASRWSDETGGISRSDKVKVGSAGTPAAEVDVDGTAAHNVVAVAASEMDLSVGQMFTKTAAGALTWTFSNVPTGRGVTVVLHLTNGGVAVQTWTGVKWPGGTGPILTAGGTDVLVFVTHDGGTTWRGNIFGKDVK